MLKYHYRKHKKNESYSLAGNIGARRKSENAMAPKEPGPSGQNENPSSPVDAYSINRQQYWSKFVDSADEVGDIA